jgi:hypothetical protein
LRLDDLGRLCLSLDECAAICAVLGALLGKSCERRKIACRRTEEERAEVFFSSASDDDGSGFKARCASSLLMSCERRKSRAMRKQLSSKL